MGSSIMPIDKQTKSSVDKPITPALSSRFRNTKNALQLRVAGSVPTSPAVTTLREPRAQTLSPANDAQTPPLTIYVTPRSGLRNSRVGTESPATPQVIRRVATSGALQAGTSVTSPGTRYGGANRTTTDDSMSVPIRRTSGVSNITGTDEQQVRPRFGARPLPTSPRSPNALASPRSAGMIRTNIAPQINTIPSNSRNTTQTDEGDGKFIRANDAKVAAVPRTLRPLLSSKMSSVSAPVVSNRSAEKPGTGPTARSRMSPKKTISVGPDNPASPSRSSPTSSSPRTTLSNTPPNRRASIGDGTITARQHHTGGHKKSVSVSTLSNMRALASLPVTEPRSSLLNQIPPIGQPAAQQPSPVLLASPDSYSARSASLTSSKTAATSVTSDTDHSEISRMALGSKETSVGGSTEHFSIDVKPTPQSQAQMQAVNARRERKVLDLEISNSSLLAINKTLERELKKQSTELRRFRRLSRAGRFSLATSTRSVSGQSQLSVLAEQDEETASSENEEEEDEEEDQEDQETEPSNLDEDDTSLISADSITARTRQRARDERRLMHDLSKHQQLLLDSQKMTQSIRRCLSFTEELVKEGKKALEYKVGIGDVKLGGRVLSNDDHEEDKRIDIPPFQQEELGSRRGLLSPGTTMTELQEAAMWWTGGAQQSHSGPGSRTGELPEPPPG